MLFLKYISVVKRKMRTAKDGFDHEGVKKSSIFRIFSGFLIFDFHDRKVY